jgi:hypothetical protein
MMLFRTLMACSLAVSMLLPVSTAEAAKKKKKAHAVHGTVTSVQTSEGDKESGTFTLKTHGKKKKGIAAEEKNFTFGKNTKVVTVTGKKKDRTETEASIADVKSGSHVTVTAGSDGKAEKVMVMAGKKGKKKKQK